MHVLITTFGSRGDVQPYVALGKGLKRNGHEVTICTCSRFESFVTDHELNYGYASNDLLELLDSTQGRDAMEKTGGLFGMVKIAIKLRKVAKEIGRQLLRDSWDAAQAANPDVVLVHPKALGGVSIAEKLGIPAILVLPFPLFVPTAEWPTVVFPNLKIGGWYNKLTYKLLAMGHRTQSDILDEFRREVLGLGAFPKSSGILKTADGRSIPVIHGHSDHVIPRPADWPDEAYISGYWFLDEADDWQPSDELEAFLEGGEPPVYVGFGSMAGRSPERMAKIVIGALQKANTRGIIATGWGGLEADALPDTILKIDSVPHSYLFPRVSAVVHHGGAGTTAAGLRAGRPTIVCPFFGDQPMWGRRVYELGAGSKPIPQKKLTIEKLAAAITEVTTDLDIQKQADNLGAKIREEDGVGQAIAIIEQIVLGG